MAWKSRVQKKSSWNSAPQQKSMFKTRGWSKRVEDSADVSQPTQPVQRRGFDLNTLRIFPDTPSPVQTKLTVGAPGDKYEQEADAMASQVMSMPESAVQREMTPEETEEEVQTKPLAAGITPLVQREAMPEEEEEVQTKLLGNATIQREAMPEEEEIQTKLLNTSIQREIISDEDEVQTKPALQRASDGSFQAGGNIESRLNSSKGGGSPLSDEVRSFMEPRFGSDFSQVRVHTGEEAVQMNRELGAQALTHGSDIYFGSGKSPAVSDLTAHELTHVVQQAGRVQPLLSPMIQRQKAKNKGGKKKPNRSISINHSITLFPQPTNMTCWSAAATMLFGDRSVGAGDAQTDSDGGLMTEDINFEKFANAHGMKLLYPASRSINDLAQLLKAGPLMIIDERQDINHAMVIGGMNGDGTAQNTELTIYNPWPPGRGAIHHAAYSDILKEHPGLTLYIFYR